MRYTQALYTRATHERYRRALHPKPQNKRYPWDVRYIRALHTTRKPTRRPLHPNATKQAGPMGRSLHTGVTHHTKTMLHPNAPPERNTQYPNATPETLHPNDTNARYSRTIHPEFTNERLQTKVAPERPTRRIAPKYKRTIKSERYTRPLRNVQYTWS